MKPTILSTAIHATAPVAKGAAALFFDRHMHPATVPLAATATAAVTTLAFTTFLATATGRTILGALRNRARETAPPPSLPATPSLRGAPSPEELTDDCLACPRTLWLRLRLGSRLADLAPTLDSTPRYNTTKTGARRIASRGPGFKGWLAANRIPATYGTLLRYRRLATRLRRHLDLDERIPLEWLLPGNSPIQPIPRDLQPQCAAAKRRLSRLLRTHRNFSRLQKYVDEALGIPRLLRVRCTKTAAISRRHGRAAPKLPPLLVAAAYAIDLEETLVENTKREFIRFLNAPSLPPKLDRLRHHALDWFLAPAL